jgi:hypothetical protein
MGRARLTGRVRGLIPDVLTTWIGLILAALGLGLIVMVAAVGIMRRGDRARLHGLSSLPESRIREARDGTVKLRGRIAGDPLGDHPFSRALVWYRADVEKRVYGDDTSYWEDVFTDRGGSEFRLDDGSAESARVVLAGAEFLTPLDVYTDVPLKAAIGEVSWTQHEISPEMRAWIQSRVPEDRNFQVSLWSLAAGTTVTVVGRAQREGGELLIRQPTVYAVEEAELQEDLAERARNRIGIAILGAVLLAAGIAALTI